VSKATEKRLFVEMELSESLLARAKKAEATVKAAGELPRYDLDDDGGNPNLNADGDWVNYSDLQALLTRSEK